MITKEHLERLKERLKERLVNRPLIEGEVYLNCFTVVNREEYRKTIKDTDAPISHCAACVFHGQDLSCGGIACVPVHNDNAYPITPLNKVMIIFDPEHEYSKECTIKGDIDDLYKYIKNRPLVIEQEFFNRYKVVDKAEYNRAKGVHLESCELCLFSDYSKGCSCVWCVCADKDGKYSNQSMIIEKGKSKKRAIKIGELAYLLNKYRDYCNEDTPVYIKEDDSVYRKIEDFSITSETLEETGIKSLVINIQKGHK